MNVQNPAWTVATDTIPDRAKKIAPLVRAEAGESERIGTMTPKVLAAMKDAGLFWMLVPRDLGGAQARMVECMEAWEEISAADASAGWSLMANSTGTAAATAFCSDEAVAQMYSGPELPIMAGMLGPGGTSVETPDGLKGTGKYRFGSGSLHATWLGSGMLVMDDKLIRKLPDGNPQVRVCWLPREKAQFDENWDVMGLQGTGSVDYSLTDVTVPNGFHHERTISRGLRDWRLYDIGIPGLACAGHTGVALGLMKRALEEITRIAFEKKRPAYQTVLGEQPVFRHDFAYHEASYRAARAFTMELYDETERYIESGNELTRAMSARFRQNVIYVHKVAADVVRFCYTMGGSESLRNPSDLGRCMRDMSAATQHIFVDTIAMQDVAVPLLDDWKQVVAANRQA
ncbi:MAG: acyl-CoA dehydrogenase family protein [Chelatococcus sp.]|jgi:alkylation response protein AidB-like acyl-CoA dehydrogenase|uniref:acyl-CoA dehydrogenase family protein n=1 Tax=unclassified Chelatococcus TaxID=2638111 RepID=UPI001BCE72A5|nr:MULTISPECIES: acyl-CoA dehydrogenase family protein [unclassified Chelatococcus]CAH1652378.1 putative Indole-3-acetate monooxygenase [Hyphomicrobiales bacterium]MBS7743041.1 acyl-CoA dehydrogenase family protein [Chelatococcus sp. HY11]MBX3538168.1 acyl-CoA dehydrogenase family protein [Chelatococcus sp.]MBX3541841.1 acyl-CoA dehydrogenase family protein [Chelatococcus sp.]MCO5074268.1 acyl-CoA dehydrogenase family protein [Chelatococcus sp.]